MTNMEGANDTSGAGIGTTRNRLSGRGIRSRGGVPSISGRAGVPPLNHTQLNLALQPLGDAQTTRASARQAQAQAQARLRPLTSQRGNGTARQRVGSTQQPRPPPNPRASNTLPAATTAVAAAAPPSVVGPSDSKRKSKGTDRPGKAKLEAKSDAISEVAPAAAALQEEPDTCPICLCDLQRGKHAIFVTSCGHQYHFKCIRSCILNKATSCPVCRREFSAMTPPASRPKPKGRSISTIVERNVLTVYSGVPVLDNTVHKGNEVHGMVSIDEVGKILPVPIDGFTWSELSHMASLTKVWVCMPLQSFWRIGEAKRMLSFLPHSLCGVNDMQREVLRRTEAELHSGEHPAEAQPRAASR